MAEDGRKLWAYSTKTTFLAHDAGSQAHWRWSPVSSSLLNLSVWPCVWEWNPDERLTKISSSLQNCRIGDFSQRRCCGGGHATWRRAAVGVQQFLWQMEVFRSGMKWVILENLSTTVSMAVFPPDGGMLVTKSIEMWDQGCLGIGRGHRSPLGGRLHGLDWVQTGQLLYILTVGRPPKTLL